MKAQTLGAAMVAAGKPTLPPRPNLRTGVVKYRKHHPTLQSPAVRQPISTAGGANQAMLNQYVKSLRGQ